MQVMERLLRFGTNTVLLFLTPLYLRDQCCHCSAAKHTEKTTLADATWFPVSPSRSGASWSHCEDQGCWAVQIPPTPQISESQKLVGFHANPCEHLDLAGLQHSVECSNKPEARRAMLISSGLAPKENIIYYFFSWEDTVYTPIHCTQVLAVSGFQEEVLS